MQSMQDRNAETSRQEVEQFKAEKPDRWVAYVKADPRPLHTIGRTITTWTGDLLGTVMITSDRVCDAFGNRRKHLTVRAINGRTYWGWWYYDTQDCIRLRAYKGK